MAYSSGSSRKSGSTTKKKNGSAAKKPAGGKGKGPQQRPIRREVGAVVCAFLGIFTFIGYFSVEAIFIDAFCGFLKGLMGWGFYLLPPALLLSAFTLGFHGGRPVMLRTVSALLLPLLLGAMAHLLFCKTPYAFGGDFTELVKSLYASGKALTCGGLVCGLVSMGLEAMFSVYGAFPVLLAAFLFFLMISMDLTFAKIIAWFSGRDKLEYEPMPEPEPDIVPVRGKEPRLPRADAAPIPAKTFADSRRAIDIPLDDEPPEPEPPAEKTGFFNRKPRVRTPDELVAAHAAETEAAPAAPAVPAEPETAPPVPAAAKASRAELDAENAQTIAALDAEQEKKAEGKDASREYQFPPIDLLNVSQVAAVDCREEIALNRERLETTLHSFGVSANIVGVTRGPTVTRYDLELESGVKLSRLTNLAGDIALALGVVSVRIAPIPDKISTVGIEVPNKLVSSVYLRDILETPQFKNAASKLSFALGKNISGEGVIGNISKLPHLLIAGTTGSGKSVCMNSLIISLLYKATPEELKLIMIDPKMVELGVYNDIPHLMTPVVTDPKKASGTLQWAVVQMLKRYNLFSEAGVRDLESYNRHLEEEGRPQDRQPRLVVVIDELADLMMAAAKDVEESICRVAQMGRAAGIHLIIATQRPSSEVITGLMKANIPSRIAFAVSSAMESRIILDQQGAEKLVGMGDMLFAPIGIGKPVRIQGAFVSDMERENVIDFVKTQGEQSFSDEVTEFQEKAAEGKGAKGGSVSAPISPEPAPEEPANDYDELLPQAVDVIFETKQASVSMLQRRLKLGYSRAARLVDQMEQIGVVGPFEGSKPRAVLITKQQWQEMQQIQGTAPTERFATEMEFGTEND